MNNFLLNLAHRSARQPALPQVHPHLMPVFMPPAPVAQFAPAYVPPAPPAFVPDIAPRREVLIERDVTRETPMPSPHDDDSRDDFARSVRPQADLPPSVPEARPRREPPPLLPVAPTLPVQRQESTPDLPGSDIIRLERTTETREELVHVQPAPPISLPDLPPIPRGGLPAERPPAPAHDTVLPQPNQPDGDVAPRIAQPPPPDMQSERPRVQPPAPPQSDARRILVPAPYPQGEDSAPRRAAPAPLDAAPFEMGPALPQDKNQQSFAAPRPHEVGPMIPSAEGPAAPPPIIAPHQYAGPRPPEPAPASPIVIERVQPAEPTVPRMPVIRQEPSAANVDVRIGTIDLQFAPHEPPSAPHTPRRRARGFDSFRRLRDYGGWED